MTLTEWETPTNEFYEELNALIKEKNLEINAFGGFKVWYSNLIKNPKILIIGINPGKNEKTTAMNINFRPSDELEYLADKPNYRLAMQMKKAFAAAELSDVLFNSTMKTNYYHIITDQMNHIQTLNKVYKGLGKRYNTQSALIIKQLINIIQPEYIICEGKSIYRKVCSLYQDPSESNWSNDCGFSSFSNGEPTIIGFARIRSNIKNIPEVAKLLKDKIM
ncbi:hypothetical protein EZ449_21945 [Pedobacter frigidisoli]|uniref:Uracil DNA glycosylase superfamily protein n=1 Tax=Pedobacter frigidisoli TaxID=2530455 RepID=A0A4R0NFP5_9SPHI|nr:hypothetical protein [Pedobacter frigidisoli]TCC97484.1 hypothetical protein EZ449_21945 [Pedobacter frigidisoli]